MLHERQDTRITLPDGQSLCSQDPAEGPKDGQTLALRGQGRRPAIWWRSGLKVTRHSQFGAGPIRVRFRFVTATTFS